MRKILISYADDKMKYSLDFLGIQARSLHIFDKVILYYPQNMPKQIQESPLFKYSRGAGYWVWKPYILWHTLQQCAEGDLICYVDAGCTLHRGEDWDKYFSYLDHYDTICFQYADNVPEFKKSGSESTKNKYWTKRVTLDFLDNYLGNIMHREFNQTLCGIIFCKNKNNAMIKEWYDLTMKYPYLVTDPTGDELENQYSFFSGNHRHDQSIFTALAYKYSNMKSSAKVLYENFELFHKGCNQIIKASRLRNINDPKTYIKFLVRYYICKYFHVKFNWQGL